MNDTTLALNNPLCFRRNLLEKIKKLIMTIDDTIRDQKLLQHDISIEASETSTLSSVKTEKQ